MSDHPALVHFYQGWANTQQISEDGMPIFIDTVMIQIERPPLLKLNREATKEDFTEHFEEYDAFKRSQAAKDASVGDAGYPLVYWPALSAAEVQMFAVRGIVTLEQLARLAGNRDLPGNLATQALRAERLMDLQKNFGKYEAMLTERDAQLIEVQAQLTDARATISAQNAMIDTLKMRVA
jgi:hypothetical protein